MAKFISFRITGQGNQYLNCDHLVNVEDILGVIQTADQTVTMVVKGTTAGDDLITLTAQTSAGNPVSAAGAPLTAALNYAITANPGGVKARVSLPLDDNNLQMSFTNIVLA
mgnify:CR=1 FL=1